MKNSAYQIIERSSLLYNCIRKDYTLINKVCLLCAKNDKIPILNKSNQDYDDNYEDDEDFEDNEDYENNDNLFLIILIKIKILQLMLLMILIMENTNHLKDIFILKIVITFIITVAVKNKTIFIRNILDEILYFAIFVHYF